MPLRAASIFHFPGGSTCLRGVLRAVMNIDLCGICGREVTPRELCTPDGVLV